jgi:acyl-CoA thioesterase-1
MSSLLKTNKPNMVVISFGMLNDSYKKTPITQIKKSVYKEIAMSLNHCASVVIVTPASTYASYTYNKTQVWQYIDAELAVAKSFHNPNIHIIDLLTQEDNYIASHGGNIKAYEADSWHPNAAGHALAGNLLAQDMENMFF